MVIACGYTDGRLGINGLASLISLHYKLDPYEKGDGFLLLTKRLSNGRFCWPANEEELRQLSPKQYRNLMEGLEIEGRIKESQPKYVG